MKGKGLGNSRVERTPTTANNERQHVCFFACSTALRVNIAYTDLFLSRVKNPVIIAACEQIRSAPSAPMWQSVSTKNNRDKVIDSSLGETKVKKCRNIFQETSDISGLSRRNNSAESGASCLLGRKRRQRATERFEAGTDWDRAEI